MVYFCSALDRLSGQVRDAIDAEERVGIPAEEYLSVELTLPSAESVTTGSEFSADQFVARLAIIQQRLVERLEAEPRVRSVAVADRLPRQDHNFRRIAIEGETSWVTVEGRPGASSPPFMPVARIDLDFFEALGQPILAGRGFGQADLEDGVSTVIVNTAFADRRLAGRNAIGQRIRFFPEERLYEIAGVVGPLGMNVVTPGQDAGVYLPAGPGEIHPLRLAVHLDRSPETFAPRMRELVNEVNPSAVVRETIVLDRVFQSSWYLYVGTTVALGVLLGILVALAASGIYAMMSFAVSERTREIGIRTALGAQKAAIAYRLGRRSIAQVGLGALFEVPLAVWLFRLTDLGYGYSTTGTDFGVAFGAGVGVTVVIGLLACLSPMRRALKIQPTEALRDEA